VQSGTHIELHRGPQPNPHEKLFNIRGELCAYIATHTLCRNVNPSGQVGVNHMKNTVQISAKVTYTV